MASWAWKLVPEENLPFFFFKFGIFFFFEDGRQKTLSAFRGKCCIFNFVKKKKSQELKLADAGSQASTTDTVLQCHSKSSFLQGRRCQFAQKGWGSGPPSGPVLVLPSWQQSPPSLM